MTVHAFPNDGQARLVGRQVAISQYRSGQDLENGNRMLAALLDEARTRLGSNDAVTLRIEIRVLQALARTRDGQQSADAFADLARRCKKALGAVHAVTMDARANAAEWQRKTGAVDRALANYQREVSLREANLGVTSYRTCMARTNLAVALLDRRGPRDIARATELAEREVATRRETFGDDHSFTWIATAVHVNALLAFAETTSDDEERRTVAGQAETAAAELVSRRQRRLGRRHSSTLRSLRAHARALILLGRHEEAVWLLRRVQAGERATDAIVPGRTDYLLALALSQTGHPGDLKDANDLARSAVRKLLTHSHPDSRNVRQATQLLDKLAAGSA